MDRDLEKFKEYSTSHGIDFPAHNVSLPAKLPDDPLKSFIPQGDREKAANPVSDYQERFLGHDARFTKPKRAANRHLVQGNFTVLGDDRFDHFITSSADQFRGSMLPRVEPFPKVTCPLHFIATLTS